LAPTRVGFGDQCDFERPTSDDCVASGMQRCVPDYFINSSAQKPQHSRRGGSAAAEGGVYCSFA
jgi:hypothetical protein